MQQEDEVHLDFAGYQQILICTGGSEVFGSILGQMLPQSMSQAIPGSGHGLQFIWGSMVRSSFCLRASITLALILIC